MAGNVINFAKRFRVYDEELPSMHRRSDSVIPPITLLEIERLAVERRYYGGRAPGEPDDSIPVRGTVQP